MWDQRSPRLRAAALRRITASSTYVNMERIERYKRFALECDELDFVQRFPHSFLVKRPTAPPRQQNQEDLRFTFATMTAKVDDEIFASIWQVVPVVKREGNPFPERLSIGRATNCDLVVRLPFISKVHAHLLLKPDGRLELVDNQASNGTFHNHRQLRPGEAREVQPGDVISLGKLKLDLLTSAGFYRLLNTEMS